MKPLFSLSLSLILSLSRSHSLSIFISLSPSLILSLLSVEIAPHSTELKPPPALLAWMCLRARACDSNNIQAELTPSAQVGLDGCRPVDA